MEMTGRMESVENLGEQRRGFASQRQVSHPFHRPLEIAGAIPTFPQPRRRRFSLTYKQQTQGDISIASCSSAKNVAIQAWLRYPIRAGMAKKEILA